MVRSVVINVNQFGDFRPIRLTTTEKACQYAISLTWLDARL